MIPLLVVLGCLWAPPHSWKLNQMVLFRRWQRIGRQITASERRANAARRYRWGPGVFIPRGRVVPLRCTHPELN